MAKKKTTAEKLKTVKRPVRKMKAFLNWCMK
jgi:hypothetical protein